MLWSEKKGYAVTQPILNIHGLSTLEKQIESYYNSKWCIHRNNNVFAIRNLLFDPFFGSLARHKNIATLLNDVQANLQPVRILYFDKPFGANWNVLWHQDRTIAVREKGDLPGFRNWTRKKGVWHTEPPAEILAQMLTVRIHLDDCDSNNGALRFLPGSHRRGILSPQNVAEMKTAIRPEIAGVKRGSGLFFRPLLLHSSQSTLNPARRRVVHIEYAPDVLPPPLQWAFDDKEK